LKKINDLHSNESLASLGPKINFDESKARPNKSHFDSLLKEKTARKLNLTVMRCRRLNIIDEEKEEP